ncbi:hypothetical protein [Rhodoplanes roseus]|nr:hypothetical protein [Rhodoplanes roseus]
MLPTFRLMLVAVAAVFVVLMVAARGLVPSPEATTRIGEVPIVGRALLQLSVIPVDETQRRLMIASGLPGELETADAEPPAAPQAPAAAAAEARAAAGTALPLVAADERGRRAAPVPPSIDPLGDLIRAVLPETPEPAPRAPVATAEEAVPAGEGGHMLTEAPVMSSIGRTMP